jgi:hypothetical protein
MTQYRLAIGKIKASFTLSLKYSLGSFPPKGKASYRNPKKNPENA